ncbi:MAG: helix-hairpin-helix domain-containing protein [Candidatus Cryptobacteroides sp.]
MENFKKDGRKLSASFVTGAVALVFLIVGYQSALFIHKASLAKIVSDRDSPDTVFIVSGNGQETAEPARESSPARYGTRRAQARPRDTVRKSGHHPEAALEAYRTVSSRKTESFQFDPNTVSIDDLVRLGFSLKQAESIDKYRKKGGRFRRREDFAKSYVVADSVYRRLEPFISIPLLDINEGDSAAFETLPGIGKYFAARMVSYREELGGYSYKEQLMDIPHFDEEKFAALEDLISVGQGRYQPFRLWTATEKELEAHPYIDSYAAHSIVLFRENSPKEELTVGNLVKAGILGEERGNRLARCRIAGP